MRQFALSTALLGLAGTAFAAGSGDHSHGDMPAGQPGAAAEVTRTIEIRMIETAGGMGYEPGALEVEAGETVRLAVTNAGALEHELVLGTEASNRAHMAEMAEMPDMEHDDPNALRLDPGESGEIVWTFTDEGTFQFACLIPGHMEAGMHGPVTVN
ncbi:cupredoxin family protein [Roseivivax sp. GX 12232]|uniref:cupredoxin domain-containing protein n=1 Tax=Roseivivax sp. GX 12232 TaxID=2900547 RepID=UPI001E4DEF7D|nr:cupredoxin family protein [Roseivivax sp. GX 12232]MCE0505941.1 cupredoxin family protein [Roseivivax sp. GX 12232]